MMSVTAQAGDFLLNYESIPWSGRSPSMTRQIREPLTGAEYQDLDRGLLNQAEGQLRVKIKGNFNDLFIRDRDGSHETELKCLSEALREGRVQSLEMHSRDLGRWANHRGQTSLDKISIRLTNAPSAALERDERGLPKVCEALARLRSEIHAEENEVTPGSAGHFDATL
jgi:hypothetical protein